MQDRQGESDGALMLTATDRPHSAVWCALHSRHLLPSLPSAALLVSGSVTLRPLKLPCQYLHVKKICSSSQMELLASIQVEVLMSTLGQLWHKVRNQTQGPMNSKDWKHIYNICYVHSLQGDTTTNQHYFFKRNIQWQRPGVMERMWWLVYIIWNWGTGHVIFWYLALKWRPAWPS